MLVHGGRGFPPRAPKWKTSYSCDESFAILAAYDRQSPDDAISSCEFHLKQSPQTSNALRTRTMPRALTKQLLKTCFIDVCQLFLIDLYERA